MRFILLPQHFSEEQKEAQRGEVTFPKHTSSRGEPPPSPVLHMGSSLGELLAQDLLGCGEHLLDTGNDWVVCEASILEGWYQGLYKIIHSPFFERQHGPGLTQG